MFSHYRWAQGPIWVILVSLYRLELSAPNRSGPVNPRLWGNGEENGKLHFSKTRLEIRIWISLDSSTISIRLRGCLSAVWVNWTKFSKAHKVEDDFISKGSKSMHQLIEEPATRSFDLIAAFRDFHDFSIVYIF